jgi:hypothetical protein
VKIRVDDIEIVRYGNSLVINDYISNGATEGNPVSVRIYKENARAVCDALNNICNTMEKKGEV